ncbi:translation initiation factor IF-2-like [Monodelphis domestica]|uniref:translation initiation factor IF-2-like n=1 Tax=Monodelphis domestica TaxID=13616 RepID=UPI0024E22052|nr:translation initiation factor IF-2-like [Monodelphis domestica]
MGGRYANEGRERGSRQRWSPSGGGGGCGSGSGSGTLSNWGGGLHRVAASPHARPEPRPRSGLGAGGPHGPGRGWGLWARHAPGGQGPFLVALLSQRGGSAMLKGHWPPGQAAGNQRGPRPGRAPPGPSPHRPPSVSPFLAAPPRVTRAQTSFPLGAPHTGGGASRASISLPALEGHPVSGLGGGGVAPLPSPSGPSPPGPRGLPLPFCSAFLPWWLREETEAGMGGAGGGRVHWAPPRPMEVISILWASDS